MDYVLKQTPTIVVELNVCCHAAQYYHYTDSKLAKCMQDCHELLQKFKPESNNDHTTTAIYRMLANGSLVCIVCEASLVFKADTSLTE